jgi:hypothetical protein
MKWAIPLAGLLLAFTCDYAHGQVQTGGVFPHGTFARVEVTAKGSYSLPPMDNARILARELVLQQQGGVKPYKFGEAVSFPLNIRTDGEWSIHPSGTARVWRAYIESPGAASLSVLFKDFFLPPNSEFYVVGRNVH